MSSQPVNSDSQSTTLLLCLPFMLALALVLAFVELLTHRHRGQSFLASLEAEAGSRMPLFDRGQEARGLQNKPQWWRFWRKTRAADAELGLLATSNQHRSAPKIFNYGAIRGLAVFRGTARKGRANVFPFETKVRKITACPDTFLHKYKLIRTTRNSNEGPIHLVRNKQTKKRSIIKQLPCQSTKADQPRWPIEAEVMSQLSHPNIIRLQEVLISFPTANVVMDFCEKGDLMNYISAVRYRGEQVPAQFILHFIASMLDALSYMHSGPKQILHRDIKSQNVFLKIDEQSEFGMPTPVLADFGLARTAADNIGIPGTDRYMAPELVALLSKRVVWPFIKDPWKQKGHHTPGTDMFGFAATVFDLLTLGEDIAMTPANTTAAWKHSTVSDHPEVLQLLLDCLSDEPAKRPTAATLGNLSIVYKQQLQAWYNAGGRISSDDFPDAWEFDDGEIDSRGKRRSFKSSKSSDRPYVPFVRQPALRPVAPPAQPYAQNLGQVALESCQALPVQA